MARYTGPKCRLCRRERIKLFLKGSRCESQKCAIVRRQQAPGQHGNPKRRRPSDYGLQLREKQKARRIYGVLEKQFRRYIRKATRQKGDTGQFLLQELERRLDNIVYRLGLSFSRNHGRQLIRQGKIRVNDRVVTIPSYSVSVGEKIELSDKEAQLLGNPAKLSWLSWDQKKKRGYVLTLPKREEIKEPIDEKLIVEYYSR